MKVVEAPFASAMLPCICICSGYDFAFRTPCAAELPETSTFRIALAGLWLRFPQREFGEHADVLALLTSSYQCTLHEILATGSLCVSHVITCKAACCCS